MNTPTRRWSPWSYSRMSQQHRQLRSSPGFCRQGPRYVALVGEHSCSASPVSAPSLRLKRSKEFLLAQRPTYLRGFTHSHQLPHNTSLEKNCPLEAHNPPWLLLPRACPGFSQPGAEPPAQATPCGESWIYLKPIRAGGHCWPLVCPSLID